MDLNCPAFLALVEADWMGWIDSNAVVHIQLVVRILGMSVPRPLAAVVLLDYSKAADLVGALDYSKAADLVGALQHQDSTVDLLEMASGEQRDYTALHLAEYSQGKFLVLVGLSLAEVD